MSEILSAWQPSDELLERCGKALHDIGTWRDKPWSDMTDADQGWRSDQASAVLRAAVDSGELIPRERVEELVGAAEEASDTLALFIDRGRLHEQAMNSHCHACGQRWPCDADMARSSREHLRWAAALYAQEPKG